MDGKCITAKSVFTMQVGERRESNKKAAYFTIRWLLGIVNVDQQGPMSA
jgi:hypothetical protein